MFGSGRAKYYDTQFVDGISLIGIRPAPSTSPSPTPLPGLGPPPPGDLTGGWGPSNIADGFQFPSVEGDDGQGQTVANVIDGTVEPSDLAHYLEYFRIAQTGIVTNEPVDGGSTGIMADAGEATLDASKR